MALMKKSIDPHCEAFQAAIDVLARPWTGLILGLLGDGPLRFSEIEQRGHGLGAKTLSARLKDLEGRRIVLRKVEAGPPVRVLYSLTVKGRAFREVAQAIQRWGRELVPPAPPVEQPRSRKGAHR